MPPREVDRLTYYLCSSQGGNRRQPLPEAPAHHCPNHNTFFSKRCHTVAYLLPPSDQITSKFGNSCKERGEGQNLFYQKGVSRLLASFRPEYFTAWRQKTKVFWQFWELKQILLRHILWGGKKHCMRANGSQQWNTQSTGTVKMLAFLQFPTTFGLFSVFPLSWRCILFPLWCPVPTDP